MPPRKQAAAAPWVLLIEFPSWQDANAARELLSEQGLGEVVLRAKHQHPSDGNVANWRQTKILQEIFGPREFCMEELSQALLVNDYNSTGSSWLVAAKKVGLVEIVRPKRGSEPGSYRFVQHGDLTAIGLCKACQPELLQCQS